MSGKEADGISSSMTLLDIMSRHREAETVFRRYDEKAGVCLCCEALFDTLDQVADKYQLDIGRILEDLNTAVRGGGEPDDS